MRKNQVALICRFCSTVYHVKASHAPRSRYCSKECSYRSRREIIAQSFHQRTGETVGNFIRRRLEEGAFMEPLSREMGINYRTFMAFMADYSIYHRPRSESVRMQWVNNDARREQTGEIMRTSVKNYYANGGTNPSQRPEVRQKIRLSKIGPKNAMYGKTGSQNMNWRGGKVDYRGGDWKRQRDKALERDNHQCRNCGKTDCVLEVHHKIPFRLSHDNRLRNLTSLCQQCHKAADTEWNRAHPVEQRRLRIF